jgi:hypothetical protein
MKFAYLIEPPFNHEKQDGSVPGCDVELARVVYDAIGAGPFEQVETEFAELLPGLWGYKPVAASTVCRLTEYPGSPGRRQMMAGSGFSDDEIDLVVNRKSG